VLNSGDSWLRRRASQEKCRVFLAGEVRPCPGRRMKVANVAEADAQATQ
jgi:hypothetical protein